MCSFLAANQLITNLAFVNFFLQPRGPDVTTHVRLHGFDFVHNLLHMTGERRPQPFVSSDGRIVALFNGEIYNWRRLSEEAQSRGLPAFQSDGEAILPTYAMAGESFPLALHGEFAIAIFDFESRKAVFAMDAFGTKPLWYALSGGKLAVASYKSGLLRLGFLSKDIHMVGPNRVLTISLETFSIVKQTAVFEFDLRQFKTSTEDFIHAFNEAVQLRTQDLEQTGRPLFIGLSSGFDSGAIHASLHQNSVRHHAFALLAEEMPQMLHDRAMFAKSTSEVSVVLMNDWDFEQEREWLSERAEPFNYLGRNLTGQINVLDDYAAIGLSYIVRLSRDRGALCYLSGTGLFPENLSTIFPWGEFFLSTQRDYLHKEEHEVKNREYKSPLHDAFVGWGYPFERRKKTGFAARANLVSDDYSILWRYNTHPPVPCGPHVAPNTISLCTDMGQGLACEVKCSDDQPPSTDTLRCGHRGLWVGHIECGGNSSATLWPKNGPAPPRVVEQG
ncbi:Asparagine synthetase [glutamine-hydrolyzing] 2 (Glutamine-dependent asparagine synthetase 2) [Durusdinium trenchii]|uniref:Asparagine synthetase [glutamine-hydrolyzing] 2 (Glutamine-dependent asparagine synthetase 2) n=1 Tax=Durusdinium trenchii TaxID=1381693 RepID=A0ABP0RFN3_9DINO